MHEQITQGLDLNTVPTDRRAVEILLDVQLVLRTESDRLLHAAGRLGMPGLAKDVNAVRERVEQVRASLIPIIAAAERWRAEHPRDKPVPPAKKKRAKR